ncbi:Rho-binding antiterminator [Klebsiella pneumoniae]|nr:Rho-binding antiterminator [Klebsiella pneumoniae]
MSMNDTYQPINCDDYDNLELACQHHLVLTLALKDGEQLQAKASDLISRKNIEYLVVELAGTSASCAWINRQLQSPGIGTVVVSES